ncbi:F-box domain [Heracleum sosnowskyi]|uniref:F-box domain n=1 Tax=Heracleum sosnowskyi TaxID=360622 RepID=A0AAD8LX76_9APIA|nr:F-box domain [Heracleum sosnowskyi]
MGAKRSRTLKQLSLVSSFDPDLKTSPIIASAVEVASNEDLLIEIMLHVPINTLKGFKSVSKQWFSLITNLHFSRLRNPLPSASALFFITFSCRSNPDYQFIPLDVSDDCAAPFKTLDFVHDPLGPGISVLQSCNGLLLCASHRARIFNHRYYVYNPTTKQFATLPQIKRKYSKYICGMNLAFDPVKSPYYKVVCVGRSETDGKLFHIEIYSSETRLWRVSGQPFKAPKFTEFQTCTYWSGSVHWWKGFVHSSLWSDEPYALYFKVEEENIEQLPMPMKVINTVQMEGQEMVELHEQVATYLGVSEGHWHLVEVYSNSTCLFNVYDEMASDYSGWFVKYQVDLSAISDVFTEIITNDRYGYTFNILSLVRRGKEEDGSFLVLEMPGGKIVRYNFADKSVVKLW